MPLTRRMPFGTASDVRSDAGCACRSARCSAARSRIVASVALIASALVFDAGPLSAHDGHALAPDELWSAWNGDPAVLLPLVIGAVAYALGVRRVWREAGRGRGVSPRQAAAFGAGLVTLSVAVVSPLDALGGALFSAHMAQHVTLMLVAAPLIVLGTPGVALLWALPRGPRHAIARLLRQRPVRGAASALAHPLAAWAVYAAVLWTWHAPGLYELTLSRDAVHGAQHASFLGAACLFWWVLAHRGGRGGRRLGVGVLYLFTTTIHANALGAMLVFAPKPWYPAYGESVGAWGLTALQDQQLGGLIMWVPSGLVYVGTALVAAAGWIAAAERDVRRRERAADAGGRVGHVARRADAVAAPRR